MTATSHTESRRRRPHPALHANDTRTIKAPRPLIRRMTRTPIRGVSLLLLQYLCATAIILVQLCMTLATFGRECSPRSHVTEPLVTTFHFCEANKTTSHRASRRPAHSEDVCVIVTCPSGVRRARDPIRHLASRSIEPSANRHGAYAGNAVLPLSLSDAQTS